MTFKNLISASVLVLGAQFMGGSGFASDVADQPAGDEVVTVASPKIEVTAVEAVVSAEEVAPAAASPVVEAAEKAEAAPAVAVVNEEEAVKAASPKAEVADEDALPELLDANGAVATSAAPAVLEEASAQVSAPSQFSILDLAAYLEKTGSDYAALKAQYERDTHTRNQVIALLKQLVAGL